MNSLVWAGLAFGFLGSVHCVGMCGPIALALPVTKGGRLRILGGRIFYNLGRVVTYMIFGAAAGVVGEMINVVELSQVLSIVLGAIILLAVVLPSRIINKIVPGDLVGRAWTKLNKPFASLMKKRSMSSMLLIGFLNGFLPCGFVYMALAGAVATGDLLSSTVYMGLFGLGTAPIMFATSLFGPMLGQRVRNTINRLIPVGAAVLAILLILRGLSLGIPYVSPNLSHTPMAQETTCCH